MKLESLKKLYVTELRELYNAEKQILVGLKKMQAAAANPELKYAFEQHSVETENQVSRLEQIFENMGISPKGETCRATIGLLAEGDKVIKSRGDSDVKDAGLIAGAQKIEHNEIACYGSVIAHAKQLGEQQAVGLLQASLDEEYATDKKLTALAENKINAEASYTAGGDYSEYETDGAVSVSVAGLLLGVAAGLAAGILLAPNTGTDTRKRIISTANSVVDQFGGQLGKLSDLARSTYEKTTGASASSSEKGYESASEGKANGTNSYGNTSSSGSV
jgi:ferritin-like metal-binding protein YciE/gas vesicle protein